MRSVIQALPVDHWLLALSRVAASGGLRREEAKAGDRRKEQNKTKKKR